jgi:hypothetical protein
MFRKKASDPLATLVKKIATAKPGEILGDVEKLFHRIACADVDETCNMVEAIILIEQLNEDETTAVVIYDVAMAIVNRLAAHCEDDSLCKSNLAGHNRALRLKATILHRKEMSFSH